MKNDPVIHAKASKIVEAIIKHPCRNCNGYGYTAEHHPSCIGDCDKNGCPHQVQCEDCHAKGYYYTEDSLTEALASLGGESDKEVLLPTLEEGLILEYKDLTGRWYEYTKDIQKHTVNFVPLGIRVRRISHPSERENVSAVTIDWKIIQHPTSIIDVIRPELCRFVGTLQKCVDFINENQPPTPSEREVLEGFAELMNKEFNELELNVCIHPSHIDRYLAEKGGEG